MATETINYGTETAITATNVNSLANNEAKPLPAVDNSSTKASDYKVYFEATLNSTGVSATGTIEVYLIESTESTTADFTDGIDPAGSANIASSVKNSRLLRILTANVNSQVVRDTFEISSDLRGLGRACPKYWALVVYNKSGAALNGSGNEVTQTAIKYDVA